jgi:hypothetical protein
MKQVRILLSAALLTASSALAQTSAPTPAMPLPKQAFVVPNFHPASCGWLANWSLREITARIPIWTTSTAFGMTRITVLLFRNATT